MEQWSTASAESYGGQSRSKEATKQTTEYKNIKLTKYKKSSAMAELTLLIAFLHV